MSEEMSLREALSVAEGILPDAPVGRALARLAKEVRAQLVPAPTQVTRECAHDWRIVKEDDGTPSGFLQCSRCARMLGDTEEPEWPAIKS